MILDQNRAVLVASVICFQKIFGLNHQIIEYWVSRGQYLLVLGQYGVVLVGTSVLGDIGLEQGGTGCQCDRVASIVPASQPG